MIRRPPRSTLFPTRRSSDLGSWRPGPARAPRIPQLSRSAARRRNRSEEHTSELQSQSNLVCRLLLEKKKIKKATTMLRCIEQTLERAQMYASAIYDMTHSTL